MKIAGILQITVIISVVVLALYFAQAPSEEEVMRTASIETARPQSDSLPYVAVAIPYAGENTVEIRGTGSIVVRNSIDLIPSHLGEVEVFLPTNACFKLIQRIFNLQSPKLKQIGYQQNPITNSLRHKAKRLYQTMRF